jgi:putative hydrolase of the HAD superfamily
MRAQVVFLDLDATLLDFPLQAWTDSVRAVAGQLAGQSALGIDPERLTLDYADISARHFRAAEAAGDAPADGHAVWAALWREALARCRPADGALVAAAVTAYERERGARYALFPDVLPALAELRQQVGRLVIITNGPGTTQRHKADATGLTALVDAVIVSGEEGVSKPDPAIFAIAARASGVPLADAWHVGDSLTSDVAGAAASGLGAGVWLNRGGAALPATVTHRPDYEIASLGELPDLLAG